MPTESSRSALSLLRDGGNQPGDVGNGPPNDERCRKCSRGLDGGEGRGGSVWQI